MIQKKELEFKKTIVLDAKRMADLDAIMHKYSDRVSYSITTKGKTRIDFDSFDELMSYSNFDKERISQLMIEGKTWNNRFTVDIDVELMPNPVFNRSVKCSYRFEDVEKAKLFEIDLVDLLNRTVENYHSRIGFRLCLTVALFAIYAISCILIFKSVLSSNVQSILIGCMAAALIFPGLSGIRQLTNAVFPRVIFAWGEEAKQYDKNAKLRSNLFWGVLVATIVAIGTGFLLSFIL